MSFDSFRLRNRPLDGPKRYAAPINVYSVNIHSLLAQDLFFGKRFRALESRLEDVGWPHVVCVQETWLDKHIPDSMVEIEGYRIYRRDRNRQGGGVAIYVRADVKVLDVRRSKELQPELEGIGVLIEHEKLHIPCFCLYRPPKFNKTKFVIQTSTFLKSCNCSFFTDNILTGDLNMDINLESCLDFSGILKLGSTFLFHILFFLRSAINYPTHGNHCIDHIYHPWDAVCKKIAQDLPIEKTHTPVYAEIQIPIKEDESDSESDDESPKKRKTLSIEDIIVMILVDGIDSVHIDEIIEECSNRTEQYLEYGNGEKLDVNFSIIVQQLRKLFPEKPIKSQSHESSYTLTPSYSHSPYTSTSIPQRCSSPVPIRLLTENKEEKAEDLNFWDESNVKTVVKDQTLKQAGGAAAGAAVGAAAGAKGGALVGAAAGPPGILVGAAVGAVAGMVVSKNVLDTSLNNRSSNNKEGFKVGVTADAKVLNMIDVSVGPAVSAKVKNTSDETQVNVGVTAEGRLLKCIHASVGPTINAGVKHTNDEVGINAGVNVANANIGNVVKASVAPSVSVGLQGGNGGAFKADVGIARASVGPVNLDAKISATSGVYEESGVTNIKVLGTGVEVSDSYFGFSVFGMGIGFGKK